MENPMYLTQRCPGLILEPDADLACVTEADIGEPELDVPSIAIALDLPWINGNSSLAAISKLSPANDRLPNSNCERGHRENKGDGCNSVGTR